MQIQFNTDQVEGTDNLFAKIQPEVEKALARFAGHITRVEVHISDVNGDKTSGNEFRAVVEIRREGKQPTAATNHADNPIPAVSGAAEKAKRLLDNEFGKERAMARRRNGGYGTSKRPWVDLNTDLQFRKLLLYPLSYRA